ncbi:hypothetical protein [Streptococcus sp. SS-4456]|uniref:hypothetical protein n=1 Tax=Streptococcus sp. SS-4456 TaxID=3072286 RepID=UPI002FC6BA77
MAWTEENLAPLIHSILNPGEEILTIYQSGTTDSLYICVLWNTIYYKVFRISNHPSTSSYKQPTFYDFHGEFYMKGAIRNYLYQEGSWYVLTKQGYYLLQFFQKAWDAKQDIFASWHKGRLQVRLLIEEEEASCLVHYRFPDNQAREVERLLASGLLTATYLSRSSLKIRISRFVAPYIEVIRHSQLYRKKPSKSMLQWEKYQSQLIELQRTYRLVEDRPPSTFVGKWLSLLQAYLCSAIVNYWKEIVKDVEWQEKEKVELPKNRAKQTDPIKDKWKKNIAKRHRRQVGQLISDDALERLKQLKSELEE